jgi:hypothetical protein
MPPDLTNLEAKLRMRIIDMQERKLKLFLSKGGLHYSESREIFEAQEAAKKKHIEGLSNAQVEEYLFAKNSQSKGNVSELIV